MKWLIYCFALLLACGVSFASEETSERVALYIEGNTAPELKLRLEEMALETGVRVTTDVVGVFRGNGGVLVTIETSVAEDVGGHYMIGAFRAENPKTDELVAVLRISTQEFFHANGGGEVARRNLERMLIQGNEDALKQFFQKLK